MSFALAMAIALALDAAFGWPDAVFRRIGHPVTWCGAVIAWADRTLNRDGARDPSRRLAGVLTLCFLVGGIAALGAGVQAQLPDSFLGTLLLAVLAWPLIAARSMADHVGAIAKPLAAGNIEDARHATAMIVARDTGALDTNGLARAALESLAENTSDGVTAPLFWGALFGLPGIAAYKVINTCDSMIGYRTPRHAAFGWAAARVDDIVNWIPARMTAVIFACLSARPRQVWRVVLADARHHRSPNAGWPEAAMAAALGVRVSGPRAYATGPTNDPFVNGTDPDPGAADVTRGLSLFRSSVRVMGGLLAGIGALALV